MRKHVELAGVLYMLWGGICMLLSLSLLSIGVAAAAIGVAAPEDGPGGTMAAGLVAAAFFVLAAAGLVFGGVHAWVGSRLRRFRAHARIPAIVLAVPDLVIVPFGTALGIYALWTLLHDNSKSLFPATRGTGR
ncbi:MAG TPA: hypothetical protein PKK95_05370 [Vicinamibacterales bacterium]|nr:hypothetical protein [Acidobacteriota bacterium]HOC17675.1 hypothetical protein [Vicinamibacterales bacterium]